MSGEKSLISILIPVYNAEKYLHRCLDSMINQTFQNIEVICVNDGSKDHSQEILINYAARDTRIKLFTQENLGPATARNTALSNALGEYIMFCDADDSYESTMCEEMLKKMLDENVDFVMCNTNHYDANNIRHIYKERESYFFLHTKGKYNLTFESSNKINVFLWNKIFKKSIIDTYGIRFPDGYKTDDNCFIYQYICASQTVLFLYRPLYNHFNSEDSIMGQFESNRIRLEDLSDKIYIFYFIYDFLNRNNIFDRNKKYFSYRFKQEMIYSFMNLGKAWEKDFFDKLKHFFLKIEITDWGEAYLNSFVVSVIDGNYNLSVQYLNYFLEQSGRKIEQRRGYLGEAPLEPIFTNSISICFDCDHDDTPYLAIAIESIIKNSNNENNYEIIILYENLTHYNQRLIESMVSGQANFGIHFYNMMRFSKKQKIELDANGIVVKGKKYYKSFLSAVFTNYTKIIYLDSDLILNTDIADLFKISLKNKSALAVVDYFVSQLNEEREVGFLKGFCKYSKDVLGLENLSTYFNSGVMVFDIEKIREKQYESQFVKVAKIRRYFNDQDVLNAVLKNDVLLINPVWNFQINKQPSILNYEESLENIKIIHYCSHQKPWNSSEVSFAELWWQYARRTPFYEEILVQKMNTHFLRSATMADILNYPKTTKRYWRYKILSKITFGKKRKCYKQKYKESKYQRKRIQRLMNQKESAK